MPGLGTIINVAAIIIGGLFGLLFGKFMKPRFQDTLMKSCGVCVIFVGIAGVLTKMLTVENGKITADGTLMMIACLAIGSIIGEIINPLTGEGTPIASPVDGLLFTLREYPLVYEGSLLARVLAREEVRA